MSDNDYDRVEFYQDAANETRWRYLSAGNNKVLADSGEGYTDQSHAVRMATRVLGREVTFEGYTASIDDGLIKGVWRAAK